MTGYILLPAEIRESNLWEPERPRTKLEALIDLTILAQTEEVTSERKLAQRWKWSKGKVHRFMLETQEYRHNHQIKGESVLENIGRMNDMKYSERDIEERIMDFSLLSKHFNIIEITRQFPTSCGIIDILAYDPALKSLVVVELKKETVDENAVGQIMRYMAAIKEIQESFKNNPDIPIVIQEINGVSGILIGDKATHGVHAITRAFKFIKFVEYTVTMDVCLCPETHDKDDKANESTLTKFLETGIAEVIKDAMSYV